MIKGKRGIQDLVVFMAIIFSTALSLIIIYYMWVNISIPLTIAMADNWSGATAMYTNLTDALKLFDSLFPFYMIGLIIWLCISAYYVKSYPFFFFMAVIVIIISIFLGITINDVYTQMIRENAEFASIVGDWTNTSWIINRLPIIAVVVGILLSVIMYSKIGDNSGYGGLNGGI